MQLQKVFYLFVTPSRQEIIIKVIKQKKKNVLVLKVEKISPEIIER